MTHPTIRLACPRILPHSIKQRPQVGTSRLKTWISFTTLWKDAILLDFYPWMALNFTNFDFLPPNKLKRVSPGHSRCSTTGG